MKKGLNVRDYSLLKPEELENRIHQARKALNAVVLVHNYQRMEVQRVADYLGDSLGLAQEAARTKAAVIVFCGVDFMAETAKILNPEKKVLFPDMRAGCPMARMISAASLREAKRKYPQAVVVTYVNSTAEVKALSDICCTSTNAVKIVKSLGDQQILFTPDRNLAEYCRQQTGANIIPWPGHCYVHDEFRPEDVEAARRDHTNALFIAHPECRSDVIALADRVASTSGMADFVARNAPQIAKSGVIIGTEIGLVEQLQAKHPKLPIVPLTSGAVCATQKMTTLSKVAWCMEHEANEIILDEDVQQQAYGAVKRMIDLS